MLFPKNQKNRGKKFKALTNTPKTSEEKLPKNQRKQNTTQQNNCWLHYAEGS